MEWSVERAEGTRKKFENVRLDGTFIIHSFIIFPLFIQKGEKC